MLNRRSWITVALLLAVLGPVWWVWGQEGPMPPRPEMEREHRERMEQRPERPRPEFDRHGPEARMGRPPMMPPMPPPPPAPLGKTLRMRLSMTPGGEDYAMTLVVASARYALRAGMEQGEGESHREAKIRVAGSIREHDGDVVQIQYEAHVEMHEAGRHVSVSAEGSVRMKLGSKQPLLSLGDKALVLEVAEVK